MLVGSLVAQLALAQSSIDASLDPRDIPSSLYDRPAQMKIPGALAAEGFCLVSLHEERRWVEGDPRARAVFGDKLYYFENARKRDIFVATPIRYLPVLDGDCLVTYADTGERAPGRIEHGITFKQRLFFFATEEKKQLFEASPKDYLRADLVDEGFCVVSKVDERRKVPGIPETVAMLDGLRYFFASAYHRKVFAANPLRYGAEEMAPLGAAAIGKQRQPTAPGLGTAEADPAPQGEDEATPEEKKKDEIDTRPMMSGYCPVSILTQSKWVRGKSQFKLVFDGRRYNFAGASEMAAFEEEPLKYVPVLGGDSVVTLIDELIRREGSVHHAGHYQGRLYLFTNAEEKAKFDTNPKLYADADLAFDGSCMVTQVEERKQVVGSPEFETTFQGKRYRFVSQQHLEKFLTEPAKYRAP